MLLVHALHSALLLLLATGAQTAHEDHGPLLQLIKDAQAANLSRMASGTMSVSVSYIDKNIEGPFELDADLVWKRDNVFWTYRVRDPGLVFPESKKGNASSLNQQPVEYMMRNSKGLYTFNPSTKVVHLQNPEEVNIKLFCLSPLEFWNECRVVPMSSGRRWVELIGPNPVFSESVFTVARDGQYLVRQERKDKRGGRLTLLMSLQNAGNVIEFSYKSLSKEESLKNVYEWSTNKQGIAYLKKCTMQRFSSKDASSPTSTYRMEVTAFDVSKPVSDGVFTLRNYLSKYSGDVIVRDKVSRQSYKTSGGGQGISDDKLDESAGKLRSSQFLDR